MSVPSRPGNPGRDAIPRGQRLHRCAMAQQQGFVMSVRGRNPEVRLWRRGDLAGLGCLVDQLSHGHAERHRDLLDHGDRGVPYATLNTRDIGAVQPGSERQFFLGELLLDADPLDRFSQTPPDVHGPEEASV